MRIEPAAFVCAALGAIALLVSACSTLPWGTAPANAGRIEITEDFKKGGTRLECQLRCAFTWGLERQYAKARYDAKAWADLAVFVLNIGYADDLSYYYLGKAAEGLGYYRAAETYYRLSREATLKCADVYGDCYGFVFPRDARAGAAAVVKNKPEAKPRYAEAPKAKEAPPAEPFTFYKPAAPVA